MGQTWNEISTEQWEAMTPAKSHRTTTTSLKRNQIPDLRMFKRRFRKEGWLSNRRFKTRSGAERLIAKLEKVSNRPKVIYSVYEFPKTDWEAKTFCVLAMPFEQ